MDLASRVEAVGDQLVISRVISLFLPLLLTFTAGPAFSQGRNGELPKAVSFTTQDSGVINGDLYGGGERGVVLAHGGRFNKESWVNQARVLSSAGFRVLAIDFRGYGKSMGPGQSDPYSAPLQYDILGAVRYLRNAGCRTVAVVGASMGGHAASGAAISADSGEIDQVVLLAASVNGPPEKFKGSKLFIIARDDTTAAGVPRLITLREQYERTPDPKSLLILEGSAHAQFIFATPQGEKLMREILQFLEAP